MIITLDKYLYQDQRNKHPIDVLNEIQQTSIEMNFTYPGSGSIESHVVVQVSFIIIYRQSNKFSRYVDRRNINNTLGEHKEAKYLYDLETYLLWEDILKETWNT